MREFKSSLKIALPLALMIFITIVSIESLIKWMS